MNRGDSSIEGEMKKKLTFDSQSLSTSFNRTTAATLRISTPNSADTDLMVSPFLMIFSHINSLALSFKTGRLLK